MKVRRAALNRIGEHTIRAGAPMATIEEPLVPIFMYHRYAVEGGGVDGRRAGLHLRDARRRPHADEVGVGARISARRSTRWRRRCKPSELTVPKPVLDADSAAAAGLRACTASCSRARPATRSIRSRPATIAADVTIGFALQLDRASRHGRAARGRSDAARARGRDRSASRARRSTRRRRTPYEAAVRRAEERVLVDRVTWLAAGVAERSGARDRVAQAATSRRRVCAAQPGNDEADDRASRAARRRHQALPRRS